MKNIIKRGKNAMPNRKWYLMNEAQLGRAISNFIDLGTQLGTISEKVFEHKKAELRQRLERYIEKPADYHFDLGTPEGLEAARKFATEKLPQIVQHH